MLGPAHPYRGGLATFIENLAKEFIEMGHSVKLKTFTLQYPSILFPGKTQVLDTPPPKFLDIERCVNSINPFNWIKIGLRLRTERPDILLIKYWTPFMAPCLSTICRIAKSNRHTKVLCQVDNVDPHEKHIIDRQLNKYGLSPVDGFVYMSEDVNKELRLYSNAPAVFSPHPLFDNFGEKMDFDNACDAIGLDKSYKYALFFGLIRDYKGLDNLLESWKIIKERNRTEGKKLIVAGEFYTSREKYINMINSYGLSEDILLHDHFIDNENVKYYFSAADFLIQPYKTATQSGVTQIAYQFYLPMIATNVGGLAEIIPHDKVGYICDNNIDSIAESIEQIWEGKTLEIFAENIIEERKRFSWREMCTNLINVFDELKNENKE